MPIEEPYINPPSYKPGQPSPPMGEKAQEVAGGVMDKARDVAKSQLKTGKSRAAMCWLAASLHGRAGTQHPTEPISLFSTRAGSARALR